MCQRRHYLVSPRTGLALSLKFLVKLLLTSVSVVAIIGFDKLRFNLKSSLELLDLGVQLATQCLLVLNLAVEGAVLLLLALQHLPHFDLVPLKVSDGLLGELQVAFDLPLELLDVALLLLFALPGVLDLVEALLKPDLQLVEMVALILKRLDLFVFLHLALSDRLFLLVPEERKDERLIINRNWVQCVDYKTLTAC